MKKVHQGQAALVLVLIMTVVSALAVSLASRSTVDTNIQQSESLGVQALISSQTGLEQLIMNPGQSSVTGDNYYATKNDTGTASLKVGRMEPGSTAELSLVGSDFTTLTGFYVCWSPDLSNPSGTPAMFISVINNNGVISDYAYAYTAGNGFTTASDGSVCSYVKRSAYLTLTSTATNIRVTVLRSPAIVEVFPRPASAVFLSQTKSIKSIGSVNSVTGTTTGSMVKYGLQYEESTNDTVPAVFDYALFSGGTIVQ